MVHGEVVVDMVQGLVLPLNLLIYTIAARHDWECNKYAFDGMLLALHSTSDVCDK